MKINKKNDNLIITLDYDPILIETIKQFNTRKYNSKTKEWIVPAVHVKQVLDTLLPLGFIADENTQQEYRDNDKHKRKINRILAGEFKEIEKKVLKDTKLPLYEYQKIGTGFLCANGSSLLGDECGLGKTIQTLATILIKDSKKNLIICPSTVKRQWAEEIEKWTGSKKITVIQGTKIKRDAQWKKHNSYYIMNFEQLRVDISEIKKIEWDTIVVDEATRISNSRTAQSKLVKTIKAKHRIALTGTPLNNSVNDLWNILDFCSPNILGTYWQFCEKYCIKDRFGSVTGYKNMSKLKEVIQHIMIRRLKSDVLKELPDKTYENIYIEFTKDEEKIYKAVKEDIYNELKEYEINRVLEDGGNSNILTKMIRLKQVTDSLELVSDKKESSKTKALKELLSDIIHSGAKAIVFTQFAEMAKILMRELTEYNPLLIAGEVENKVRKENIDLFQGNEENKILISTEAGGMGVNLQRAQYVIHFDNPWSIAKKEQREGRIDRIGQKNKITIFNLIVTNSIDEYVLKILHKKQKLSEDMLGDKEKGRKYKISKKDIQNILS